MRLAGKWMKGADDRILEFISEEGPSTPKKMHDDGRVRFSRGYINKRCQTLADHDLLINLGNGVYNITDDGLAYLNEELDAEELDADDENGERRASA